MRGINNFVHNKKHTIQATTRHIFLKQALIVFCAAKVETNGDFFLHVAWTFFLNCSNFIIVSNFRMQ